jgi:non-ribosomal peptide synthetase component F
MDPTGPQPPEQRADEVAQPSKTSSTTVIDRWEETLAARADLPALIYVGHADANATLTFRELDALSNQVPRSMHSVF